ncbi:MAG: hypothetical protein FJW23_07520 [Acidimicrobiia bacterium]|nr:hypothetical protein [Acidimicrobiia bacterium]
MTPAQRRWFAGSVLAVTPFLVALACALWVVPYAISETVGVLEDLEQRSGPARALFEPQAPLFRPAFWGALRVIWDGAASIPDALATYRVLHIATVLSVPLAFLLIVRPASAAEAAAAALALATLVGSPAFRDNLENLPLNQMMVITLIGLLVWQLAAAPGWWRGPVILLLTFVAIGFKEEGLAVSAAVALIAWFGAPGISRRTGFVVAGLSAVYVGWRLLGSGDWPVFMQDVGLGFASVPASDAVERFGSFPYPIYAYNALASAGNVLFSEPTSGVFRITRAVIDGTAAPWQIVHLASSIGATALAAWWAAGAARAGGDRDRRLLLAFLAVLVMSAALGFKYTRDRFGGVAVAFYALVVFEAAKAALARADAMPPRRWMAAALLLVLLQAGWQLRTIGTLQFVRDTAELNHKEWLVDVIERRRTYADKPVFLEIMDALQAQGTDPRTIAPGPDPRWFARVLGER